MRDCFFYPIGTVERKREGRKERRAVLFERFRVLLQPPQFADKGFRCQGDSAEKGKVSGCGFFLLPVFLRSRRQIDKMISVPPPQNKSRAHDVLPLIPRDTLAAWIWETCRKDKAFSAPKTETRRFTVKRKKLLCLLAMNFTL